MVAGKDAPTFGEGKNSWLTGTAAWTFTVLTQGILGIQPDYEGLKVDPCIPDYVKEYKVNRRFRNTMYHITIRNESGAQKGVKKILVDRKQIEGKIIPVCDKKNVKVEVII
jgi:cellobiose phosphorylase